MKNIPLVSIIVPSFNVEKYIKKCLDSITNQTYANWECIIVDRPSTKDETTSFIKEYIKGDNRFHFIKQINKGVSDGRNVGFAAAKGKYIQFTDPDDWLAPNLLELAVQRAEDTGADIVQFAWSNYYVQDDHYTDTGFMPYAREFPLLFSVETLGNEIFKYGEFYVNSMSKLWRREYLQNINLHFPENLKRAEDLAEVSRLIMNASKITYLDEILYFYKIDEYLGDTLSNFTPNDEHALDFYEAIMVVYENMKKMKLLPRLKDAFCRVAIDNSMYALHMSRFSLKANKEIFECIQSVIFPMIKNELKSLYPDIYELFSTKEFEDYLGERMWEIYFDNLAKTKQIKSIEPELIAAKAEINSYLSIKRSARLTLGNIKRRIKKIKN